MYDHDVAAVARLPVPEQTESVEVKLDRVLAKLDRIERVVGALIEHLPMRWRVAVKAAWHGR